MKHACITCALHLLKSEDSKIEGHVLLNAGFLFLDAYPEIKQRKCDTPALPHKLSRGRQVLNSASTRVVAYVCCDT